MNGSNAKSTGQMLGQEIKYYINRSKGRSTDQKLDQKFKKLINRSKVRSFLDPTKIN